MIATEKIHILLIDDSQPYFAMIQGYLRQTSIYDYDIDWAGTWEQGLHYIQHNDYDLCLLDYDLAGRNGLDLLRQFRHLGIKTPTILLTARGNYEVDLDAMQAGATDYLDKNDLNVEVFERSLRYAVQHSRTLQAVRDSEKRLQQVLNTVPAGVFIYQGEQFRFVNPMVSELTAYTETELRQFGLLQIIHPDEAKRLQNWLPNFTQERFYDPAQIETRILGKDGQIRWVRLSASLVQYEGQPALLGAMVDITGRIQMQRALLDTSAALNSALSFDAVLEQILDSVGQVIPHDSASIMLVDNARTRVVRHRGYEHYGLSEFVKRKQFVIAETHTFRTMYETHEPIIIEDTWHDARWTPLDTGDLRQLRSYLGAPIIEEEQVIGFINLDSHLPQFFTHDHAVYLRLFANQAASAIRNARASEQAQELAAAQERQHLARELHDAVSQTLFSSSFIADSLPGMLDSDPARVKEGLQHLAGLNRAALAEMRSLLMELRPQAIVNMPLAELLSNLATSYGNKAHAQVDFQAEGTPLALPDEAHLNIYRIAQEALNNIRKHARARRIQMQLHYRGAQLALMIEDDGSGFQVDAVAGERHGLRIMHERAQKINAEFAVESQPGRGTSIYLLWPADSTEEE